MVQETKHQRWLLSLISIVAAIGGFLFGYDTGVISGALLYIKKDFLIMTWQTELIVGIASFGSIIGALSGGFLNDRFGRKAVVLLSGLLFIFSAIGLALADSIGELIFWRIVVGLAIGISSSTTPLYIAELVPRSMRGKLVTINQLAITIGILMAYLMGLVFVRSGSWRVMFALAAVPALIQFVIMSFFSESPRYLIKVGKVGQAFRVLSRLRGSEEGVRLEVEHIKKVCVHDRVSLKELFAPAIRPALLAGIGLTVIQQLTGINTIIYYSAIVFQLVGLRSDIATLDASIWVGVVNVLSTFIAIYLIDRVGRKPLILCGLGGMIVTLFVLGIALHKDILPPHIAGVVALVCILVYIASFAYSLGPGGWLVNSEIYPLHVRGKAIGIATCSNWVANFIITSTFLSLINAVGKTGTFWIYALIGIFGMFFIWKKVPETKGQSLEEIEEHWKIL